MIPINTPVGIFEGEGIRSGVVVGYGQVFHNSGPTNMLLVRLDFGEYLMSGKTYIGTILVHPDNIVPQNDST